jgi:hypothetical protein
MTFDRKLEPGGSSDPLSPTRLFLRRALLPICAVITLAFGSCASQSDVDVKGKAISGYVRMTQVQAAYLGSGNAGSGVLTYNGRRYPFSIGGLGVGGIGISKIEAKGEVYGLASVSNFAGSYVQARYGGALGNLSTGELWLKNSNGVVMRLIAKRQGLMLSLGGDAVVIRMNY